MQIIVDILVYNVSNLSRDQKEVTGLISACSGSRVSRGHGLHETGTFWYQPVCTWLDLPVNLVLYNNICAIRKAL